jgi:hypothetical protein
MASLGDTAIGVIAKVGDHALRQNRAQHCCGRMNGIAATAFKTRHTT